MNNFFRLVGIATCIYVTYRFYDYAYEHYYSFIYNYFFWAGVVFTVLLVVFTIVRISLGNTWHLKLGASLFLGGELKQVSQQLVKEFKGGQLNDMTLTSFATAIFRRLTRVWLVGLLFAGFPLFLLIQQNQILQTQNDKIDASICKIY